jgi:hypothetical protein
MPHDKIRDAARRRMAATGESYTTARRRVIADQRAGPTARRFLILYDKTGLDWVTAWLDAGLFRTGPGVAAVTVGAGQLRIAMGDFRQSVPLSSVRAVARTDENLHGTTGVHAARGRLLVNGSARGLVQVTLDPPARTGRSLSTGFLRSRVDRLVVSLTDPDGFVAAVTAAAGR